MQTSTSKLAVPRLLYFALFLVGLVWLLASRAVADRAAEGVVLRFNLPALQAVLQSSFLLVLLLCGFSLLSWLATRQGGLRASNGLPNRATYKQEFFFGAALGWTMLLAVVLPLMLFGALHPEFWWAPRSWALALLSLLTLLLATLASEVAFRGFLYRTLLASYGPVVATILLAALYALLSFFAPDATLLSVTAEFALAILLSLAYLRTHALWFGWGVHFAWNASLAVLFGLPLAGHGAYSSLVTTDLSGAVWFTGGAYGPEGSLLAVLAVLGAFAVLYRVTRNYAWEYTHAPIVSGGHPMDAQPPAAHVAMERSAQFNAPAAPAPLVQILGSTSQKASTVSEIEQHLRKDGDSSGDPESQG
ncbi:MAG: CPBP family intramembrane metalloprotease [Acidobacteriaceae bacterium]|nr:CPBP family intramembrane metalloprotease [Acidobacteriaceae bacterium]